MSEISTPPWKRTETACLGDRVIRLKKLLDAQQRGEKIMYYPPEVETKLSPAEPPRLVQMDEEECARFLRLIIPMDRWQIITPPEPQLPKGIFWVRRINGPDIHRKQHRLVIQIDNAMKSVGLACKLPSVSESYYSVKMSSLFKDYVWSHDRETWYTFNDHTLQHIDASDSAREEECV